MQQLSYVTAKGKVVLNDNYKHDGFARVTEVVRNNNSNTRKIYNDLGQLVQIVITPNHAQSLTYTYAYDPAGNLFSVTINATTYQYQYNAANKLIGFGANGASEFYPRNQFGTQIVGKTYVYGLDSTIKAMHSNFVGTENNSTANHHYNH